MADRKVFVAGATGVIGRRLVPLLVDAGYMVFGATGSLEKRAGLRTAAVEPVVIDVYDAKASSRTLAGIAPQIVINQLTDLPPGLDPARMSEGLARNARIRSEGTRNLVAAALRAGAQRMIAQSIAWVYAAGRQPHVEDDPLDRGTDGELAITVNGIVELERLTLQSPPLAGIVLRYGRIYGPGTGSDAPRRAPALHVDAAAHAVLLGLEYGESGVFNIAEDNEIVSSAKARRELGWDPGWRMSSSGMQMTDRS